MENAIKKSIDGGYKIKNIILEQDQLFAFGRPDKKAVENECVLDPLFWQALGKQQEWDENRTYDSGIIKGKKMTAWEYFWHSCINHIAVGGSVDDFFNNLIK